MELWSEELQNADIARDMSEAEHTLHIHNESVSNMQQTALDVIQRGQELYQVIVKIISLLIILLLFLNFCPL